MNPKHLPCSDPPATSLTPAFFLSMDSNTKVDFKVEGTEGGNKHVMEVHTESICTARALKDV